MQKKINLKVIYFLRTIFHISRYVIDALYTKIFYKKSASISYEKIIFTNDSIYGPFFNLNNIISYGEKHSLDMWGATDSYMIKYHIQSYFIVFSKSLFLHPLFNKFWDKVYNLGLKNNIIIRYE